MKAIELKKGIYWVGVKDWDLREFHGYTTSRGSTYNSYLIIDDKITLIDGVKAQFRDLFMSRIASIIDPSKIDVVVCNHVEMDHSGTLSDVMKAAPNATLYCPVAGERGLKAHYDTTGWKIQTVKTGDTLNIGKHTLSFVLMPMVHWPDSMMTYMADEKILFPNDAFGQHYATDILTDEVNLDIILDEAKKYYGNIVWPYGGQVQKVLEIAAGLEIDMICPSHGVCWIHHISDIIEKYKLWSAYGTRDNKAVIVFDSMWGTTEKMAMETAAAWGEKGLQVTLCNLKVVNISDAVNAMVEAKYVGFGSAVLNNGMMPPMGGFMTYLKGLAPKNKVGFCFGSYGWKKDALKPMEDVIKGLGWEMPEPTYMINWRPTDETIAGLRESALRVVK